MAKDRSLVRASDIGAWAFCNRAWWLSVMKEAEHADPALLARGTESHASHGRLVTRSHRLRRVGTVLVLIGAVAILLILAGLLRSSGG